MHLKICTNQTIYTDTRYTSESAKITDRSVIAKTEVDNFFQPPANVIMSKISDTLTNHHDSTIQIMQ